jgi:hypothetical protein
MANVLISGLSFPIDGANAYIIGGQKQGQATLLLIDLRSTAFSGSITVKARAAGSANTPVAIAYRKRYLNGAVGDETFVSTAITTDSIIEVNAAGVDVVLDCTSFVSGLATATVRNITG